MTAWIGLGLYVIVALFVIRPLTGHFAWGFVHEKRRDDRRYGVKRVWASPQPDQWFGALLLSVTLAAVWPAVLVWIAAGSLPKVGAEALEERERLARRVKELEKELEAE
jgi:hypothetical protein